MKHICFECGKEITDYYKVGSAYLCAQPCYEDFVRRNTRESVYGDMEDLRRAREEAISDRSRKGKK